VSVGQLSNDSDPVGELLGLLRSRRRRLVIYYLRNHTESEPIEVDALASAIADMEVAEEQPWEDAGQDEAALTPFERGGVSESDRTEHVRISLVHNPLPKLDEKGVVEFDFATGTVRATHPPKEFWDRLRSYQQFSAGLAATEVK